MYKHISTLRPAKFPDINLIEKIRRLMAWRVFSSRCMYSNVKLFKGKIRDVSKSLLLIIHKNLTVIFPVDFWQNSKRKEATPNIKLFNVDAREWEAFWSFASRFWNNRIIMSVHKTYQLFVVVWAKQAVLKGQWLWLEIIFIGHFSEGKSHVLKHFLVINDCDLKFCTTPFCYLSAKKNHWTFKATALKHCWMHRQAKNTYCKRPWAFMDNHRLPFFYCACKHVIHNPNVCVQQASVRAQPTATGIGTDCSAL